MRKHFIGRAPCQNAWISYYLLEEKGPKSGTLYGVQAELMGETAAMPGLTTSQPRIRGLLASLIQGGVTPVTLENVVEDWLLT